MVDPGDGCAGGHRRLGVGRADELAAQDLVYACVHARMQAGRGELGDVVAGAATARREDAAERTLHGAARRRSGPAVDPDVLLLVWLRQVAANLVQSPAHGAQPVVGAAQRRQRVEGAARNTPLGQGRQRTSPWTIANQPSSCAGPRTARPSARSPAARPRRRGRRRCLAGDRGGEDAVRPHAAPPGALARRWRSTRRTRSPSTSAAPAAAGPGEQPPPASGSAAVAVRDRAVELEPAIQPRVGRVPGHRRVVGVAGRHHAVRPGAPAASRAAPRPGRRGAGAPGGRARRRTRRRGSRARRRRRRANVTFVDARGLRVRAGASSGPDVGSIPTTCAGRHPGREVGGDRAGAAADVEHERTRAQVRDQVGGRVGDRPRSCASAGRSPRGRGCRSPRRRAPPDGGARCPHRATTSQRVIRTALWNGR